MDELMEEIKLVGQVLNCLLALIEVYLFDISKNNFQKVVWLVPVGTIHLLIIYFLIKYTG